MWLILIYGLLYEDTDKILKSRKLNFLEEKMW